MADYKSERTKKIEKSKVDEDMPMIKNAVRETALGISRAMDKVESLFKKQEEDKKMAKGGYAKKKTTKMAVGGMAAMGGMQNPALNREQMKMQKQEQGAQKIKQAMEKVKSMRMDGGEQRRAAREAIPTTKKVPGYSASRYGTTGTTPMAKGGAVKKKDPAKKAAAGMLVIPVKVEKTSATKSSGTSKKKVAKKK